MIQMIESKTSDDGSIKYAFEDDKHNQFETMCFRFLEKDDAKRPFFHYYMQEGVFPKYTICISSQCGCAMACKFCATGYGGFFKNLSHEEMFQQIEIAYSDLMQRKLMKSSDLYNVIFMGMGEPLMNYKNVVKLSHRLASVENCLDLISISTIGVVPRIDQLAIENDFSLKLFISLHSPYDNERSSLMPINDQYSIERLLKSAQHYSMKKRDKVIICYLLIDSFNDSEQHAHDLSALLNSAFFEVQLLLYNPIEGIDFKRPREEKVKAFFRILQEEGLTVDVRVSKGQDIDGGCGQLIRKMSKKKVKAELENIGT